MSIESGVIISGGMGGETWNCTPVLRWVRRWIDVSSQGSGDTMTITKRRDLVLQQYWQRLDAPGEEWRDVPTVEG